MSDDSSWEGRGGGSQEKKAIKAHAMTTLFQRVNPNSLSLFSAYSSSKDDEKGRKLKVQRDGNLWCTKRKTSSHRNWVKLVS